MPAWPATEIFMRAPATLAPYERNPRAHSVKQIEQIAASISRFGFTMPILADEAGQIIAGHARLQAAQQLELPEVPVMIARGWSAGEKRAYVIADNKLTENGTWDEALLRLELGDLRLEGFNLALTGFSDDEIAGRLAGHGRSDADLAPEPPADPVSRLGDCWHLGRHRLVCGDCTDPHVVGLALAGMRPPHLMVTDPPYGVEYDADWRNRRVRSNGVLTGGRAVGVVHNDDRADWRAAWALFPGDVAYVWQADRRSLPVALGLEAAGFVLRAQIIWSKSRFVIGSGDYHFQHEPCWYAVRHGRRSHWTAGRDQTTLWSIEHLKSDTGHSTQKPVECMRRPIANNSHANETIYDPFAGSGTTLIAAEMMGRICLAIELDPAYCDVGVLRWQTFTGQQAVLDGRTYAQVKRARAAAPAPVVRPLSARPPLPSSRSPRSRRHP